MKYKLLFLDVDGTLVPIQQGGGRMSDNVIQSIKNIKDKVYICLATGRTYYQIEDILKQLEVYNSFHVIEAGARVVDSDGYSEYVRTMDYDIVKQVLSLTEGYTYKYHVCVDGRWELNPKEINGTITSVEVSMKNKQGSTKVKEILKPLSSQIHYISKIYYAFSGNPDYKNGEVLIITPHGINKGYGIRYIQQKLGISKEETAFIGDEESELSGFQESGLKIAMGNAVQILKQNADYITADVAHDGVKQAIDEYIA